MLIRKLREEDPFIWSMGTLAKLFMTEPSVIGYDLSTDQLAFLLESLFSSILGVDFMDACPAQHISVHETLSSLDK